MRIFRDASMIVFERPDLTRITVSAETTFYETIGTESVIIGHKRVGRPTTMLNITRYDSGNANQSVANFAGTVFPNAAAAITYLNTILA